MRRKHGTVVKLIDIRTSTQLVRKVPLRLVQPTYRDGNNIRKNGVDTFEYVIDIETPAKIRVSHADPHECAKLAQVELEAALTIVWRDWIMVSTDGEERMIGAGRERPHDRGRLGISYRFVQTGLRGGKPVWREVEERGEGENLRRKPSDWIHEGAPVPERTTPMRTSHTGMGREYQTEEDPETESLIDDTPHNRQRVQSYIDALLKLRRQVQELLSPENIQHTLTAGTPLLLAQPTPAKETARVIDVEVKKEERSKSRSLRDRARGRKRS